MANWVILFFFFELAFEYFILSMVLINDLFEVFSVYLSFILLSAVDVDSE